MVANFGNADICEPDFSWGILRSGISQWSCKEVFMWNSFIIFCVFVQLDSAPKTFLLLFLLYVSQSVVNKCSLLYNPGPLWEKDQSLTHNYVVLFKLFFPRWHNLTRVIIAFSGKFCTRLTLYLLLVFFFGRPIYSL